MRLPVTRTGAARVGVFLLCLTPFLKLVWDGLRDDLTANPIEDLTHRTGWWTLTLLMVTLTVIWTAPSASNCVSTLPLSGSTNCGRSER